jgi:hypothetical protein
MRCYRLGACTLIWLLACSAVNHTDPLQRAGAFVLRVPSISAANYNLLDDAYTATDALADVRLDSLIYQADSSVVLLCGGQAAGGLFQFQTDSSEAPADNYAQTWALSVKLFPTPTRFWLCCRDGQHYARLTLDSLRLELQADSSYVCAGYFRYRLNLDEGEREF